MFHRYFLNAKKKFKRNSFSTYLEEGKKQEGETCGACFNPSNNFTCGKCIQGLECVPDKNAALLPDLPSKCRKVQSKILHFFTLK